MQATVEKFAIDTKCEVFWELVKDAARLGWVTAHTAYTIANEVGVAELVVGFDAAMDAAYEEWYNEPEGLHTEEEITEAVWARCPTEMEIAEEIMQHARRLLKHMKPRWN